MDFEAFVKDITDNKWNVHGVEVYENEKLTHSFGDTEGIHDLYSATKTITSIAVGIVYDEGKIDLEETVLTYLPDDKVSKMSEDQYNTWKKITLRRLMTMSVADIPFVAEGDSWIDFALSCPISNPEEKVFNYSNINTYLVGVCLTKAIGSDLGAFIEDRIFKPLDIVNYEYARCPEGYFYGASRAKLSVHDLSKIGLLLYNGGEYNGKRIVSKKYVDMATSVQQMNREGGYGLFIWKYRDGFSINGKLNQKCYILPNEKIIVTYLSNFEDESHSLKKSMEKNILNVPEIVIRPDFDSIRDFEEFSKYYWYREELIKICKKHGLKADGGKIELNKVIEAYFSGEKILPTKKSSAKTSSKNKGKVKELTLDTGLIECGFIFGPRFRDFFVKQTGEASFKFNVDMVATAKKVKETGDESFKLGDLLDIYYGKKTYATYDKSALQWNKFVKDFCADEATLCFENRLKSAAKLWKIIRESDRKKEYSHELLEEFMKYEN